MQTDPHETWYVAKTSFAMALPGGPVHGTKNVTRVRGDDPIYLRAPELWKPLTGSYPAAVEEAVAAPGRKRGA